MTDREHTLNVRGVPHAVWERLRARAKANGRSVESELRRIIASAAFGHDAEELARGEAALMVERAYDAIRAVREAAHRRPTEGEPARG